MFILCTYIIILLQSHYANMLSLFSDVYTEEFCQFETLELNCPAGHVIVMESASFGLMEIGRCVETELAQLGCAADVLQPIDGWCSGRQTCSVQTVNSNEKLQRLNQCVRGIAAYTKVEYNCIKGNYN